MSSFSFSNDGYNHTGVDLEHIGSLKISFHDYDGQLSLHEILERLPLPLQKCLHIPTRSSMIIQSLLRYCVCSVHLSLTGRNLH